MFSLASDISFLRNLSPGQKFFALGQTIKGNFHFTQKDAAYAWLSYYSKGKLNFKGTAKSKSLLTNPQQIPYSVRSTIKYNQYSVGWKRYLKGSFDIEKDWALYGYAGFGLLFGKAENVFDPGIDTIEYNIDTPFPGIGKFTKLTFDIGLGAEYPVITDLYVYSEIRTWIAASDYPSGYLRNNKNFPSVIALNIGARILF